MKLIIECEISEDEYKEFKMCRKALFDCIKNIKILEVRI